jgi:hypothetical protein
MHFLPLCHFLSNNYRFERGGKGERQRNRILSQAIWFISPCFLRFLQLRLNFIELFSPFIISLTYLRISSLPKIFFFLENNTDCMLLFFVSYGWQDWRTAVIILAGRNAILSKQAGRLRVRDPMGWIFFFFNLNNTTVRTMTSSLLSC